MSTSRSYLRKRLIAVGRADLVQAVESGQGISMYHAAEEAGLITRRPILGSGSPNQTKARLWAMAKITRRAFLCRSSPRNRSLARHQSGMSWMSKLE